VDRRDRHRHFGAAVDQPETCRFALAEVGGQQSMLWVGTGLVPSNTKAAKREDLNYLDSFGGRMAQSPSDAGIDETPTTGDIDTAKAFSIRVGDVVRDLLR
jgi:NAD(P)H dehydrogenase (quinone)